MANKSLPTIPRLHELFYVEQHELYWRVSRGGTARAGTRSGSLNSSGYLQTMVDGRNYLNHRILWAMHYGAWPTKDLDHINRIKIDNRVENLREVSNQENHRNRSAQSNNKLGIKGVRMEGNKFRADIRHDGDKINLGLHLTALQATQARASGELKYWGHISQDTQAALARLTNQRIHQPQPGDH